ncbi:MAG TPA: 4a-hydroxytetrahydrobiopterin dehydratase [Ilumatobacteraceae bacterium]|nr:4a-hydroxytetrahydrobiopterin dehydratase [Ilumatobacteraceae bacterium]
MEYTEVAPDEFAAFDGVGDWTVVDGPAIAAVFRPSTYLAGADLVKAIAEIAEAEQHHPDMEIRYPGTVHVTLTTHATGGLTTLDVDLARLISAAAASA